MPPARHGRLPSARRGPGGGNGSRWGFISMASGCPWRLPAALVSLAQAQLAGWQWSLPTFLRSEVQARRGGAFLSAGSGPIAAAAGSCADCFFIIIGGGADRGEPPCPCGLRSCGPALWRCPSTCPERNICSVDRGRRVYCLAGFLCGAAGQGPSAYQRVSGAFRMGGVLSLCPASEPHTRHALR